MRFTPKESEGLLLLDDVPNVDQENLVNNARWLLLQGDVITGDTHKLHQRTLGTKKSGYTREFLDQPLKITSF